MGEGFAHAGLVEEPIDEGFHIGVVNEPPFLLVGLVLFDGCYGQVEEFRDKIANIPLKVWVAGVGARECLEGFYVFPAFGAGVQLAQLGPLGPGEGTSEPEGVFQRFQLGQYVAGDFGGIAIGANTGQGFFYLVLEAGMGGLGEGAFGGFEKCLEGCERKIAARFQYCP